MNIDIQLTRYNKTDLKTKPIDGSRAYQNKGSHQLKTQKNQVELELEYRRCLNEYNCEISTSCIKMIGIGVCLIF